LGFFAVFGGRLFGPVGFFSGFGGPFFTPVTFFFFGADWGLTRRFGVFTFFAMTFFETN
jgi:hypothetical protein